MKDFTVLMSLVDYIPVAIFAVAAVIFLRDFYNKMSKGAFALFAAGEIDIIVAGFIKATYKLLYALGVCDFEALSDAFFPMQSLGFLIAGIGMIALIFHKQSKETTVAAVAPAVFKGTMVFVGMIILGLAFIYSGYCYVSKKLKKPAPIVLFVFSFICYLGMGYLSSRNFAEASMNWIAEGVNIIGSSSLLVGAVLLHKFGLSDLKLRDENVA